MKNASCYFSGADASSVRWSGKVLMDARDADRVLSNPSAFISGWRVAEADGGLILLPEPNLVVAIGAQQAGDRNFGLSGLPAVVQRIGVDNGTTNPTATSVSSDAGGGADTGSSTQTLRTFDSAATRTASVISATGTFNDPTTGGIGAVSYAMRRLFLSRNAANATNTTSADAANSLYSMTNVFTVDFTTITTWTAAFTATVTLAGT